MPRKSRIDATGAMHHIMARGIERRERLMALLCMDAVIKRVCAVIGIEREQLYTRGKGRKRVGDHSLVCYRAVQELGLIPIRLQVCTFVVAALLSSTYCSVRLRRLLAAASVSILNANWY